MAATEKRTFSLPVEQAAFIDQLVDAGSYATASEVIRDGLRVLQARNAAVERWLREEVAPAFDAAKAHPERLLSTNDVMQNIRARNHARRASDK